MDPAMMAAMQQNMGGAGGGMPGGDDFQAQFDQLGMKPEDVMKKIMDNPELAQVGRTPRKLESQPPAVATSSS
jgi:hypothetical protein